MAEITFRDLAHAREVLATQTGANFNPSIANAAQTAIMDFQQDVSVLNPINSFQNLFGMGKTYPIDAPVEETLVIDSTGERTLPTVSTDNFAMTNKGGAFPPNSAMMQREINQANNEVTYPPNSAMMQREINQGLLSNPNYDMTSFYESPVDYDMTSFYESPVDYDMTSFYESPNAVDGINTVQEVEDVQTNSSNSIIDGIKNAAQYGPVGSAFSMINNPSFKNQAIPGALAMAGGFSMIPGGGILGLLGGALNAMGAYHDFGSDPDVGQVSYQTGLLSAPTNAPGGYIYQDGYLSNLNSFNSMNPDTEINVGGGNGYATAGDLYQGLAQTGAGVRGEDYDRQASFGGNGDAGNSAQESYDSWAESDN
tara:strand:+ start:114 stop:1217 length:1104 start_codon:yes stop_codon:yes gene_type:complete